MNKTDIARMFDDLPYSLRERVMGYVNSVEIAIPEIFRDAEIQYNEDLAETLLFVASLRKFFSIVNSAYWTLENTGEILERQNTRNIRIGGSFYSRYSPYYEQLFNMHMDLEDLLKANGLYEMVYELRFVEILRQLSNER